ncbi:MAG: hypothetical protein WBP43_02895 [Chitinophagales bacterium]
MIGIYNNQQDNVYILFKELEKSLRSFSNFLLNLNKSIIGRILQIIIIIITGPIFLVGYIYLIYLLRKLKKYYSEFYQKIEFHEERFLMTELLEIEDEEKKFSLLIYLASNPDNSFYFRLIKKSLISINQLQRMIIYSGNNLLYPNMNIEPTEEQIIRLQNEYRRVGLIG